MKALHQITYRAPTGSTGEIRQEDASFKQTGEWLRILEPVLRTGRPMGRGYLDFGASTSAAVLIRWYASAGSPLDWQYARALVGERDVLTPSFALELPNLDQRELIGGGGLVTVPETGYGQGHEAIAALAGSPDARDLLVPLLARVLAGERRVTMPWKEPPLPEAATWGLISILDIIGDTETISFLTYASGSNWDSAFPGRFVAYRPGAALVPPDSGFMKLATFLAERFAADPGQLRQSVSQQGVLAAPDHASRVKTLLAMSAQTQSGTSRSWWTSAGAPAGRPASGPAASPAPAAAVKPADASPAPAPAPAAASPEPAEAPAARPGPADHAESAQQVPGSAVVCPICLSEIQDWNAQGYWRYDPDSGNYREIEVPSGLNSLQRARRLRGAHVRCPASQRRQEQQEQQQEQQAGRGQAPETTQVTRAPQKAESVHYLPMNYGRFGPPVVLGFVGLTTSGKSTLLASMVGGIVAGELNKSFGITYSPLDHARHRRFMDDLVKPLLERNEVLKGTPEEIVEFVDAFVLTDRQGRERAVAFFDVAGGDLVMSEEAKAAAEDKTKQFLWIADGLFFVVDPGSLDGNWAEDETFSNVLDVVRDGDRSRAVSAAVVLNKADMVRFDEPAVRWLRSGAESESLNATDLLRESADVYAYLESKNALALADPYYVCHRATLHIASPTGGANEGDSYPRGVRPQRVIRPLAAMLAMTGVLTGAEADEVGI